MRTYGAQANGQPDTKAIQAAVDACKGKGGVVYFPPGTYVSGMIQLGSDMTLRLDAQASLQGVKDSGAYPFLSPPTTNGQLLNCRRALLYAERADRLVIEGPGTIDGSGGFQDWKKVKEAERPMAIFVMGGTGLKIRNLHVRNAAMWAVVLMETTGARVSWLDVDSRTGSTRDGLDIVDGQDIRIDHVTVFSEDDSICLKSGLASGLRNVWVTDSHILGSLVANGLKFGTASKGLLSDIHFENIQIEHVAQAAMAIESVDGSRVDGVTFKNVRYRDTGTGIFVLLGWRGDPSKAAPGSIEHLVFQDIQGESSRQAWGSAVSGTTIGDRTYFPRHLLFQDVKMRFKGNESFSRGNLPAPPDEYHGQYPDPSMWPGLPSEGLYFRHVKDIVLRNTQLERMPSADARPILVPNTGKARFDAH